MTNNNLLKILLSSINDLYYIIKKRDIIYALYIQSNN